MVNPKPGPGQFQWNTGGWFGAMLGSTAFMLVGGIAFISSNILLALVWLICYGLTLAIGIHIWTCRETFAPYPALQCLLLVIGIFASITIISALLVAPQLLTAVNLTPGGAVMLLLMIPGFMILLHVQEMLSRNGQPKN